MREIVHMSSMTTFIGGIIWLLVTVSAQASNLVSVERKLATVFSRNLAPAIDVFRCFALSEQQISEQLQRMFMGEMLELTSPANHRFEFKLVDDRLQQRFVGNNEWHDVDSAAYRVLLAVAPEQRWQVFDAVQNIIVGTNTAVDPTIVSRQPVMAGRLIVDDVRNAVDELARHENLIITDGVGLTGNLANFLKQPKNHVIANMFYRQFLAPLVSNIENGLRGQDALTEIDGEIVSSDQHQVLYTSRVDGEHSIYFAVDNSNQSEWIIVNLLLKIANPHNASIIGMARKAINSWDANLAKRLEHSYPELIEVVNPGTEVKDTEMILHTLAAVRSIASDPQLVTLEESFTKKINTLTFKELLDKYIDLIDGLYLMLFAGTEHDHDALFKETQKLFWVTTDHLIVVLDDYPKMISFLQRKPKVVVNNMVYPDDLLRLHHQKIKNLVKLRLIDGFTNTARLLEENSTILTKNPVVVDTLNKMGIDDIDDNKTLANLLYNWRKKISDLMELHDNLRVQFTHYVNTELQYAQPTLDGIKLQFLAMEQEGWTVFGNNRKVIVTSQFAKFHQQHEGRITNFSLKRIVRISGGIENKMLKQLRALNDKHLYGQDLSDNESLKGLLELLGNPHKVKLVGGEYIDKMEIALVMNGIETNYDIHQDARPVYQLTYWDHRIYAQAVELDGRIYLVFLNGFHKEAKHLISDQIQSMQKNRQSKVIVDAINILAKIDDSEERKIAQFKLEQSVRQLYYDQHL